jgi:GNAT superfamily N-acetyltransferase
MIQIRDEIASDAAARERLLDACFGPARVLKTSQRLREGRLPARGLALTATRGDTLVGTVRLWDVATGCGRPALLLGPLAVDPALQGAGLGGALMRTALTRAADLGHGAVLLVGVTPASASRRNGWPTSRCPARSSARASSVSISRRAPSTAPWACCTPPVASPPCRRSLPRPPESRHDDRPLETAPSA